jgi:hypothetical protein
LAALRITHYKFADLQFVDWHTSEILGFGIVERASKFADMRYAEKQKKFACPSLQ